MVKTSGVVDLHNSVPTDPVRELTVLQDVAEREFTRQRRLHRRRFKCRRGCDACCHTPFVITEVEAAAVHRAASELTDEVRQAMEYRATDYLATRLALFKEHGYRQGRGELAPAAERLPCPALVDGACIIYADRPVLCRLYGAALMHADYSERVFACQLNFAPGERIEDPRLEAEQQTTAAQRTVMDRAYVRAGGRRYPEPLTVAHALLGEFRPNLPPKEPEA